MIVIKVDQCKTKGSCRRHEDEAKRDSPMMDYGGVYGGVFIKHVLASAIKKGGPLEEIKIIIIQLKWIAQGKGMILIGLQDRQAYYQEGLSSE